MLLVQPGNRQGPSFASALRGGAASRAKRPVRHSFSEGGSSSLPASQDSQEWLKEWHGRLARFFLSHYRRARRPSHEVSWQLPSCFRPIILTQWYRCAHALEHCFACWLSCRFSGDTGHFCRPAHGSAWSFSTAARRG